MGVVFSLLFKGLGLLPGLLQGVEAMFGAKTGAQKRAAALEIVGSAISVTDMVANKQIANSAAFTAGLGQVIDGVVACLNASVWAKV